MDRGIDGYTSIHAHKHVLQNPPLSTTRAAAEGNFVLYPGCRFPINLHLLGHVFYFCPAWGLGHSDFLATSQPDRDSWSTISGHIPLIASTCYWSLRSEHSPAFNHCQALATRYQPPNYHTTLPDKPSITFKTIHEINTLTRRLVLRPQPIHIAITLW